ncbi:MAG: hypothetical protein ILO53_06225 [Clostridia bacterium]|nr:hypothetical protein [Clostridia bacterium]
MDKYYESLPHFSAIMENLKPAMHMDCKTLDEYVTWKDKARARLSALLCLDRMTRCDPEPKLISTERLDGYTREKWTILTEPDVVMPFYRLVPDRIAGGERRPAVIATHGHGCCGKEAVVGNGSFPELADAIRKFNNDYGVSAVKKGAIVFCPDARGFGERREYDTQGDSAISRLSSSCSYLNFMALPLGRCLAGTWVWDLMRLADHIEAQPDVMPDKLGCIGLSGGGLQVLYLTALDDRVTYAACSGYFYGFRQALLELYNCSCNYVPHMWENFDVGDIGALIAPRPFVIETGDADTLNGKSGLANVLPYVEQVRSAYRLFDRENMLCHDVFEGPHTWHGTESIRGIERFLFDKEQGS